MNAYEPENKLQKLFDIITKSGCSCRLRREFLYCIMDQAVQSDYQLYKTSYTALNEYRAIDLDYWKEHRMLKFKE